MTTPFWSVMIPTYRDDPELLRGAIESVLDASAGHDLEIVVVNDGVAADVAALVEKFGDRVRFTTNAHNLGVPENFNECVRQAAGAWVHILHADDVVQPDFYTVYEREIAADPQRVMIGGQVIVVDEHGTWIGVSPAIDHADAETIAVRHPCNFASTVVARAAYAQAGGFDHRLVHANDWEMWVRIARLGAVGWVPTPHAFYRRHSASDSARLQQSSAYIHDCRAAIDAIVSHFDDPSARLRVRAGARIVLSDYVLGTAAAHLGAHRRRAAIRDALWGVCLRPNLSTLGRASDTIGRAVLRGHP